MQIECQRSAKGESKSMLIGLGDKLRHLLWLIQGLSLGVYSPGLQGSHRVVRVVVEHTSTPDYGIH